MVATNAAHRLFIHVLHVILACAVSFQITKLGNIESINTVEKFSWVSGTTKIFLHENLKQKFYNTKIFRSTVLTSDVNGQWGMEHRTVELGKVTESFHGF